MEKQNYFAQILLPFRMIPATPITEEVRLAKFVEEEWSTILSKIIGNVSGGWKGLLYTSYATINRGEAFNQLMNVPLDDGLSRAWALVSVIHFLAFIIDDFTSVLGSYPPE